MKAAVLNSPSNIEIVNLDIPEPKENEVRVKLLKVGICGSDTHLYLGHRLLDKKTVIGHEGIGIIDKLGSSINHRVLGERVAIEPNIPCRNCKYCLQGKGNICINKRIVGLNENGCFAEYICLPADFCWEIPETISDQNSVCIEPMAVAYHALFSSKAKPGDTIAILGLGAIGLLLSHLAVKLGYKVLVTELNQNKIALAVGDGAIQVSADGDLDEQIKIIAEKWLEQDVVAVFECAGTGFTASLAAGAVPRGAELVLVGLSEKNGAFKPLKIAREGINFVPSIIYDHPFDFKRVLQLMESKIINPSFIISRYYPLENIKEALDESTQGEHSKIIINV